MRKLVSLVLTLIMVALAVVAATMFISLNNHNNNTSDVRSTVSTAAPTVAPTVAPTEAPMLPVATFAPFAPVTTATAAPVVATSAPVAVVTAPVQVSSLDVSKKTIVTDDEGNFRQMMIRSGDLSKVDYDEIVIDTWNGVSLLVNTDGVVGEIFTREDNSNNVRRAGIRKENVVKNFFNANGEVKSDCVREGYAVSDTEIGTYNLTNIRFVQIAGEENYRLVINGRSYTGGGNGGKADPTATPAPTQEPTQQPTQEPVLPTLEPTKEPGGNNNPNEPVLPTLEPTKAPGGNNSDVSKVEPLDETIGSTESGGENSDLSNVNSDDGNSSLDVTVETTESSVAFTDFEFTSDSNEESVEDLDGGNSELPPLEDF